LPEMLVMWDFRSGAYRKTVGQAEKGFT
jgi:hypothetical protein